VTKIEGDVSAASKNRTTQRDLQGQIGVLLSANETGTRNERLGLCRGDFLPTHTWIYMLDRVSDITRSPCVLRYVGRGQGRKTDVVDQTRGYATFHRRMEEPISRPEMSNRLD